MRCAGLKRLGFTLGLFLILSGVSVSQMKPGDRRNAYGEARASVIESVLKTLYPGATVEWDPYLTVQRPGEKPRMVQVPVYVKGSTTTGGLEGVASVEFEGEKEKYIFEARGFQRSDSRTFNTLLVVFRADAAGRIERYKKLILDPGEPLTEIKTLSVQEWSQKEWPTLEIQYDTHVISPGSFTTIEWHSVLDANSGKLISRLPFGIIRRVNGASEQRFHFQIVRTSPTTVAIADREGETHEYNCSEPCVMDRQMLFSQWVH